MAQLNFHHLRYFWTIAQERSLTRAAQLLHVSQSALSVQLKQLEDRLGHPLFERRNRRLVLTEAGRIALDYAQTIFKAGDELVSTLKGSPGAQQLLRVGASATLSRNFQIELMRPLLGRTDVELVLRSGSLRELLLQLRAHALDVVLSNRAEPRDAETSWHNHLLAEQQVSLVSRPTAEAKRRTREAKFRFPDDLRSTPIVLPSTQSELRAAFDVLLDRAGIRPIILAEVDDMAMLRLLARESPGVALVPPVVVRDELREGRLVERCKIPQIKERFYAITLSRRFPNPLVREILEKPRSVSAGR